MAVKKEVVTEEVIETEETLADKKEDLVQELEVVEDKLQDIKEEKSKWPWPELSSLWEDELIAQLSKVEGSHVEKNAIKAIINGLIS